MFAPADNGAGGARFNRDMSYADDRIAHNAANNERMRRLISQPITVAPLDRGLLMQPGDQQQAALGGLLGNQR